MNQFLKGLIWVCLGLIPFLAWNVSDNMFFPFITGKNFIFRALVEVAFSAWIILAMRDASYRLRRSLLLYVYLGFMIVIGIADMQGVDRHASLWSNFERMEGYITHLHLFAYFLTMYGFIKGEKSWNRIMGLFVAANVPVLIEGFMQLLGRPEFFFAKIAPSLQKTFHDVYPVHMSDSLRLDSSLGNAAYYGIYTLFNFIFALLLIYKADYFKYKGEQSKLSQLKSKLSFDFRGVLSLIILIVSSLLYLSSTWAQAAGNNNLYGVTRLVGMVAVFASVYYFAKGYNVGLLGRGTLSIIALMNLMQLYYTQTRGSYLGLVGGLVVAIVFVVIAKLKKRISKTVKTNWQASILTVISAMAVILILGGALYGGAQYVTSHKDTSSLVKNNVFLNRLATINIINPIHGFQLVQNESLTYEDLNKYFGDITIVSRFLNAKIAVEGWHDRPWLGYGQENYKNVFDKYFDPRMYSQEAWFDRTHNVFFDWLVAGGALGLVFYLALYLTPYYIMWLGKNRNKFALMEKSAISGILVAYFIHNIFVFDNLVSYVLFFMLLAYVSGKAADDNEIKGKVISEKIQYIVGSLVVLILIITAYYTLWKPYSTNRAISDGLQYKQITNYIASQGSDASKALEATREKFHFAISDNNFGRLEALEQFVTAAPELVSIQTSKAEYQDSLNKAKIDFITEALTQMDNYASTTNYISARSLTIYAGALAGLRLYPQSLTVMDRALAEAPSKQILLNFRAQLLNMMGRNEEAYQTAKKSYLLDTTFKAAEDMYMNMAGNAKMGKDFEETMKKVKGVSKLPYDEKYVAILIESKLYASATKMINEEKAKHIGDATTTARLNQLLVEMYKTMRR